MNDDTATDDVAEVEVGTALVAPTDAAIQSLRAKGSAAVAFARERNALAKTIEGIQWGSVAGSGLSIQTRTMLAQFCVVTRANPLTQVDILGGKPYLNANYWFDLMVNHPYYIDHSQRSLTEESEKALRKLAADHRAAYGDLRESAPEAASEQLVRALELEREVSEIVEARALWTPRKNATAVFETTIRRFMNQAPLEAIKSGEVSMDEAEKWIIEVKECNWAGNGNKDPVGNAEPEKTARTRSVRRTAVRAFSAWLKKYDDQIRKAEEAIEAEWEFAQDPSAPTTGPQAVLASGEPEAGDVGEAQALPVRGEAPVVEAEVVEEEQSAPQEPAWDPTDARKRFFATLHDIGVTDKKRKAWAKEHKFPESTKDWTKEDYARAQSIMVDPLKELVAEGCGALGLNIGDLSLQVLGKDEPDFAKDYNVLISALEIRLAAAGSDDEEDAGL